MQESRSTWRGSRRRFLQLTAASSALAAAACSRGGAPAPTPTDPLPGTPTAPRATPSVTPRPTGARKGGTLRFTGYVVSDSEFDPHKTQSPPVAAHQSLVCSRLLTYESQAEGTIGADLALALPERPDPLTLVVRLNPSARWDSRPPLNGRAVTADDVRFSIERQRDGNPSFVRRPLWTNFEAVAATSAETVTIRLKEPLATALHRLADAHSFIVAPEAIEAGFSANQQPGSGPFRAVEWNEREFASVVASEGWYGGNDRPYLDGITIVQPRDATEVEAALRTKKLDVAFVGRPAADRLRRVIPQLTELPVGTAHFFGMRFFTPVPPFNDPRFRSALAYAIDRREMIRQFFADAGEVNPWISWPLKRWSLPQAELATQPGYRAGTAGRAQDIAEAKALLDAYRADGRDPGDLVLYVVDEAERSLGLGTLIKSQVSAALGLTVNVTPLPLAEIIGRLLAQQAPWVTGPDSGWIDLDDWVYPYFHSAGTRNSFALRDADLDALINAQRVELDERQRQQIGHDIQRKLMTLNAGVNFVSERLIALAWPYVRDFPLDVTDGYQGRLANTWLDQGDATFRGR